MPHYVKTLYRFSVVCGALPLAGGAAILAAYALTRASWLEGAGFGWILFGLCCFALGSVALAWAFIANRKAKVLKTRQGWLSALLLLSNFPAAYGCLYVGIMLTNGGTLFFFTDLTVVVRNNSQTTLKAAEIRGACCHRVLGDIPPHEIRKVTFHIDNNGALGLVYQQGTRTHEITISPDVGIDEGGSHEIVVNPDESVNVEPPPRF